MSAVQSAEEYLFDYVVNILSRKEVKEIQTKYDILNSLNDDAEEDIKNEVWSAIKEELNYRRIIEEVGEWLKNTSSEDEEEEEEEEEEEQATYDETTDEE